MRILVLMPCDERSVYHEMALYLALQKKLDIEQFNEVFPVMNYAQWLVTAEGKNWAEAAIRAVAVAEKIARNTPNCVILGNQIKKPDVRFDAVFTYCADATEPYKEVFLPLVMKECGDYFKDSELYGDADSIMNLTNVEATAQLLCDYLKTDPNLDKINEEYKDKINGKRNDRSVGRM